MLLYRRAWRVFSYLAPSLNLDPVTDMYGSDYPFSVVPDNGPVTKEQLMFLMRDHYEGKRYTVYINYNMHKYAY
jgi:dipeptidase